MRRLPIAALLAASDRRKRHSGWQKNPHERTPAVFTLRPPLLTRLDEWIRKQKPRPTRPEAIHRILAEWLERNERGVEIRFDD